MQVSSPIVVGITGGIGSGKTTVAKYFDKLGVPIYFADDEAKALMNRSKVIKRKLVALFGQNAYNIDGLNREFVANKIFSNQTLLAKMNAVVHPKVGSHFKRWLKKQNTPYILKEVAIIFENKLENQYDLIITVVADKEQRVKRVMARDNKTQDQVLNIINNQLPDKEKIKKSHFIIHNNSIEGLEPQVQEIHNKILAHILKN